MPSTECDNRIELVKNTADMMDNFPLEGEDSTVKRVGWVIKAAGSAAGYGASCYNHADNAKAAYTDMLRAFNDMTPHDRSGWNGNIRDVFINDYYAQRSRLEILKEDPTDLDVLNAWIDDLNDSVIASTADKVWIDAIWEMGKEGNVESDLVPDMMRAMYYLGDAFDWHFFETSTTFQDIGASKDLYDLLKEKYEYYYYHEKWPLEWVGKEASRIQGIPKGR